MKKLISLILLFVIYVYRSFISPIIPASCRYLPTCSEYSKDCIIKHGPFKGLLLTCNRILKCHPWGGSGYDPVP
jgi:putative membrane protein insertion efficiency factor